MDVEGNFLFSWTCILRPCYFHVELLHYRNLTHNLLLCNKNLLTKRRRLLRIITTGACLLQRKDGQLRRIYIGESGEKAAAGKNAERQRTSNIGKQSGGELVMIEDLTP